MLGTCSSMSKTGRVEGTFLWLLLPPLLSVSPAGPGAADVMVVVVLEPCGLGPVGAPMASLLLTKLLVLAGLAVLEIELLLRLLLELSSAATAEGVLAVVVVVVEGLLLTAGSVVPVLLDAKNPAADPPRSSHAALSARPGAEAGRLGAWGLAAAAHACRLCDGNGAEQEEAHVALSGLGARAKPLALLLTAPAHQDEHAWVSCAGAYVPGPQQPCTWVAQQSTLAGRKLRSTLYLPLPSSPTPPTSHLQTPPYPCRLHHCPTKAGASRGKGEQGAASAPGKSFLQKLQL